MEGAAARRGGPEGRGGVLQGGGQATGRVLQALLARVVGQLRGGLELLLGGEFRGSGKGERGEGE
jgi:hypothetical protein